MKHRSSTSLLTRIAGIAGIAGLFLLSTAAQAGVVSWTVYGVKREALVFEPTAKAEGGKVPLVFVFHGHGGNAEGAARNMGLQKAWPEALVVYMQGLPTQSKRDPEGRQNGWQRDGGDQGDRDLKFIDAALAGLRGKYPVDDHRIYATGFSNGAFFTYLLWAERGKTFAALAPCAGLVWPTVHLSLPRPVLHIAGEADDIVPFDAQKKTIELDRQINHAAEGAGVSCGEGCTRYPSSPKGNPVEVALHSGGHIFPPNAAALIVRFFKEHSS